MRREATTLGRQGRGRGTARGATADHGLRTKRGMAQTERAVRYGVREGACMYTYTSDAQTDSTVLGGAAARHGSKWRKGWPRTARLRVQGREQHHSGVPSAEPDFAPKQGAWSRPLVMRTRTTAEAGSSSRYPRELEEASHLRSTACDVGDRPQPTLRKAGGAERAQPCPEDGIGGPHTMNMIAARHAGACKRGVDASDGVW